MSASPLTHKDYKVGWVCALPKEQTAATAMLDAKHGNLSKPPNDPNTYTLGSIGGHNVVIACLPKGRIGTTSAATVAIHMANTFPAIRFGLMVGIGGGVPIKVRLGDVVVSAPVDQYPGVVQYDMGKAEQGGKFRRTGALNNPPSLLLAAVSKLETEHEMMGSKIPEYLEELKKKYPRLAPKYLKSESLVDVLFKASYNHVSQSSQPDDLNQAEESGGIEDTNSDEEEYEEEDEDESCRYCDNTQTVRRRPREMKIHYGLIASGNQVIKDAVRRDSLVKELGGKVLCVEMEASGLMNDFPCLVIRGICDYADSHKNKAWQEYAAAIAAAYAKELLSLVVPDDVDEETTVKDVLSNMSQVVNSVREDTSHTRNILTKKEDVDVLNWVSPDNYGTQQSDNLKRWHLGTAQWFLDSKVFQDWLLTENHVLYCPGIPGAGKTTIVAAAIQHIRSQFSTNSRVGLAYIYFTFSRQIEQTVEHVLASLLMQLLRGQSFIPDKIRDLYSHHSKNGTRPTRNELSAALHSIASDYERVFILIDALDECTAENESRAKILSEVFGLRAKSLVSILATSRVHHEIESKFDDQSAWRLPIIASDKDMYSFLQCKMKDQDPEMFDESLRNIVASEIIKVTEGMFLLAELHLTALVGLPTKGDIKNALRNLARGASGLDKVYNLAMERIKSQGNGYYTLAKHLLLWIVHARRPLSTIEIQHALAIQPNTSAFNRDYMPSIRRLKSICAGLVTIDEQSGVIRLIHYTTQEYFKRTAETWFPDAQQKVTNDCITYLSFEVFGENWVTSREIRERLGRYPFYGYAARNWGHHARNALSASPEVIQFLQKDIQVDASNEAIRSFDQRLQHTNGLHLAASFGLEHAVKALLDAYDPNHKDSLRQTPLLLAARKGYATIVEMLLTRKINVNSKDRISRTPLSWAAKRGNTAVVKLLLSTEEVDVNAKDRMGQIPLSLAAEKGNLDVVQLLLSTGKVDVNSKDRTGRTPLSLAAEKGNLDVAELLLATDNSEIDSKDSDTETPLIWAVENRNKEMAELLLTTGKAKVNSENKYGWTPLWRAAVNGHKEIVELLVATGKVNVNSRDCYGRTPLMLVAKMGKKEILELLLTTENIEIDSKDDSGMTPLFWAVRGGFQDTVKLLLATGKVEVDSEDGDGRTPLSWAAGDGNKEIVKLLLATGKVDINSKDSNDLTPLMWAGGSGNKETAELLLTTENIDIDSKDDYGMTILLWAVKGGFEDFVELLLSTGRFEVNAKDSDGRTLLSFAIRDEMYSIAKHLLDHGAIIKPKDVFRLSPTWHTVIGQHRSIETLLLPSKAQMNDLFGIGAMFDR